MIHPLEVALSTCSLTTAEASGETLRQYGLQPERAHNPGTRTIEPWSVLFVHPVARKPAPKPSARRAAPRPPLSAA